MRSVPLIRASEGKMRPLLAHLEQAFARHHESHWAHLSRLTNLLVLLNISLFFLTELVTKQNYFYTFFSLLSLASVQIGLLLPLGLLDRLWCYALLLAVAGLGIYFLVASIWYWVATNKAPFLLF